MATDRPEAVLGTARRAATLIEVYADGLDPAGLDDLRRTAAKLLGVLERLENDERIPPYRLREVQDRLKSIGGAAGDNP